MEYRGRGSKGRRIKAPTWYLNFNWASNKNGLFKVSYRGIETKKLAPGIALNQDVCPGHQQARARH